MNRALLELAWNAEQPSFPSPPPTTDAAWVAYAMKRIEVYSCRVASMAGVLAAFPPAGRAPTSLDAIGAPTIEDSVRADEERRDLWRLALEVPPWRGPFTPGLMRLLLWATTDGDRERLPVLRPLEREILSDWHKYVVNVPAHPTSVGAALSEITGANGLTWRAKPFAQMALDAIESWTWGAVECELYSAAVAAGLVPRVWRRNPLSTRLDGEFSRPWPR